MELRALEVFQGNSNGKEVKKEDNLTLFTTGMDGCIAICIESEESLFMIHSDTNNKLKEGIELLLGGNLQAEYKVSLYGGNSKESLEIKFKNLRDFMPNMSLVHLHDNCDAAYFCSSGQTASTKAELAEKLDVPKEELSLTQISVFRP